MSTRKPIHPFRQFFQQIGRLPRAMTKGFVSRLLRGLLAFGRRPLTSRAGFVLPTTILLLLVVTLAVGSLTFRTFSRTQESIGERQQRVIYNAATPAIDRAKAKLEFLFDSNQDTRYPGGVPSEGRLMGMMLYDPNRDVGIGLPVPIIPGVADPYTFPGEERIDIGQSASDPATNGLDNAWRFRADLNGDGQIDPASSTSQDGWITYSILFRTPNDPADTLTPTSLRNNSSTAVAARASALQVRNAPLSNVGQPNPACQRTDPNNNRLGAENGWFRDPDSGASVLRKNFQVDAFVAYDDPTKNAVSTLEFSQDRKINRGNKWGAWFRNDLEVYPGATFNWNGAMHTEGSLVIGSPGNFTSYLISSPQSCLYSKENSEITIGNYDNTALSTDANANGGKLFQGQAITGTVRDNNNSGNSVIHIHPDSDRDPPITSGSDVALDGSNDSLSNGNPPGDYTLDPVILLTESNSKPRGIANPTNPDSKRNNPLWSNDPTTSRKLNKRVFNQREEAPYVDDSYRADNRFGPKPKFKNEQNNLENVPALGQKIVGRDVLTQNSDPSGASEVGLDGYWERRALTQGLRLIVGQRLELGNAFGWNFGRAALGTGDMVDEPLRPWSGCKSYNSTACNQARQRRSLYDNLAAVQATAVYHANGANPDFPRACIATTVHPGTGYTLERSSTFENLRSYDLMPAGSTPSLPSGTPTDSTEFNFILSDFFRGRGTNGWEYEAPNLADLQNAASPLRIALKNLATFAGDPSGGAPSFMSDGAPSPLPDQNVHPYPSMAMWGDFSILRRILEASGMTYDSLSPADKSTLHTAACTLGMLAHNIQYLQYYNPYTAPNSSTPTPDQAKALRWLSSYIVALMKQGSYSGLTRYTAAAADNPNTTSDPVYGFTTPSPTTIPPLRDIIPPTTGKEGTPEDILAGLEKWRQDAYDAGDTKGFDRLNRAVYMAQMIMAKEQVYRDLRLGFNTTIDFPGGIATSSEPIAKCKEWQTLKDPLFALCSAIPHYPILYSLFPSYRLDLDNLPDAHGEITGQTRDQEDSSFPYWNYITTVNAGNARYQAIDTRPVAAGGTDLIGQIALKPQPPGTGVGTRVLPYQVDNTATKNPNNNRDTLIHYCDTPCLEQLQGPTSGGTPIASPAATDNMVRVAFKDSAMYNGRELLNVRVMDMNLDTMRQSAFSGAATTDFWLPKSGIIYAFREDAVGENNIVRPKSGSWTSCSNNTAILTSGCRMDTGTPSAARSTDPPLRNEGSLQNLISPKPVDYYPDPDRRPNGFRLRNGEDLGRTDDKGVGMTLVSDNPVYIQGDFNLHRDAGGTRLEEFTTLLTDNFSNFYARNTIDSRFASALQDRWRPAEILADAITILSDNFCDGSAQDGILTAGVNSSISSRFSNRYNCQGQGSTPTTSYLNMNRPSDPNPLGLATANIWMRANRAETAANTPFVGFRSDNVATKSVGRSPIRISRWGNPVLATDVPSTRAEYDKAYYALGNTGNQARVRNAALDQRVNAILVSGIVPARPDQDYGGLHNFPRFLENWSGKNLFIAGSFIQLNFSNYATAPFDQDAFEVGATPVNGVSPGGEFIEYYEAPNRRWGYDVGLQYAPAGPLAQRFITLEKIRSEFYNEPPANDPYIKKLCEGAFGSGSTRCPS